MYEDELQGILFSDLEVVGHQSSNAIHFNRDGILFLLLKLHLFLFSEYLYV